MNSPSPKGIKPKILSVALLSAAPSHYIAQAYGLLNTTRNSVPINALLCRTHDLRFILQDLVQNYHPPRNLNYLVLPFWRVTLCFIHISIVIFISF